MRKRGRGGGINQLWDVNKSGVVKFLVSSDYTGQAMHIWNIQK